MRRVWIVQDWEEVCSFLKFSFSFIMWTFLPGFSHANNVLFQPNVVTKSQSIVINTVNRSKIWLNPNKHFSQVGGHAFGVDFVRQFSETSRSTWPCSTWCQWMLVHWLKNLLISCLFKETVRSLQTRGTNVKTISVIVTLHECFAYFTFIQRTYVQSRQYWCTVFSPPILYCV